MSAVSNNVTPASIAMSTIRLHSRSSGFPQRPNIIVPSPSVLTCIPRLPRGRCSTASDHPGLLLEREAVPVVDAMTDVTVAHQEPHHPANLDRWVVGGGAQRVGRPYSIAVGNDVFDIVSKRGHRRQ